MRKKLLGFAAVTGLGLVLAACTPGPVDPETGEILNTREVPSKKFLVGGSNKAGNAAPVPVDELDDQQFLNVFHELAPDLCSENGSLNACIQKLKNSKKQFQGLSGITGRALLRAADSTQRSNGKREIFVKGQILENCAHDPLLSGYSYNSKTRDLRLCVLMITEIPNAKDRNSRFRYQYFHVEAKNARVDKRDNSNPDNIFPAAASATGLKIKATAENQHLNLKLYANGRNIRIVNYWEANAQNKNNNPKWKMYTKSTPGMPPRIAAYFDVDKDACVDMLFPGPKVPPVLSPADVAGVHYCLGRCKHPPIVNTK